MTTDIIQALLPMSPLEGPPLPSFMQIYWPWVEFPEAEFILYDLDIYPREVNVDEPVQISVTARNIGEQKGQRTISLGGDFSAEQTVILDPGQAKRVSFRVTPPEAGTYDVTLDGLPGMFTAIAPPPEVVPPEVAPPKEVTFRVVGKNFPPGARAWSVEWVVCDEEGCFCHILERENPDDPFSPMRTRYPYTDYGSIHACPLDTTGEEYISCMPAYEVETERFTAIEGATYTIDFAVPGTVPPPPPSAVPSPPVAEMELANLVIEPRQVYVGESVNISVIATNILDALVSQIVSCKVNGTISEQKITLNPGEQLAVEFTATPKQAKEYVVRIGDLVGKFTALGKPFETYPFTIKCGDFIPPLLLPEATRAAYPWLLPGDYEVWEYQVYDQKGALVAGPGMFYYNYPPNRPTKQWLLYTQERPCQGFKVVITNRYYGVGAPEAALAPAPALVEPIPPPEAAAPEAAPTGPSLSLTKIEIMPLDRGEPLYVNDFVSINAIVENTGDASGSRTFTCTVDGFGPYSLAVEVPGRDSKKIAWSFYPKWAGEHTVEVDGFCRTFTVLEPL